MIVTWYLLLPGLLLLLFPADRLLSSMVQLRNYESFLSLENSPRFRPWWWVPVLWMDPLRGLLGTLIMVRALGLHDSIWTTAPMLSYALLIFLLAAAVLCQTLARHKREALLAPIGFVAGIVAALMPVSVALIGLAAALMSVFAFRRFHAFFTVGLAMTILLAFLFGSQLMWLAPAGVAMAMPVILSIATGLSLDIPTRDNSGRTEMLVGQ